MTLRHAYRDALPPSMWRDQLPVPVAKPEVLVWNGALAASLGLDGLDLAVWAGNAIPDGAQPISQAYSGHQFGNWVPQLGDGRQVLLGEAESAAGLVDVALKGSGQTPFSRRGDGRAALGPMLREFLISEAMAALGVPTTRSLAVVATGEWVRRDRALPGAVLTRIAASHIRVGTFEYAARDEDALTALTAHAMARHDPDAATPMDFLRAVVARQARLVATWMGLGFIHGVMNTDNMAVSGETTDYGPCAFMDAFRASQVFSSIDAYGRYAWAQQPNVAAWNLAQLASAMLPVLGGEAAIPEATAVVQGFADAYRTEWAAVAGRKLGLDPAVAMPLMTRLLPMMEAAGADFTVTFRALTDETAPPPALMAHADWPGWMTDWTKSGPDRLAMAAANPAAIPRNHQVEAALAAAERGDLAPFAALHQRLADPYQARTDDPYTVPPRDEERVTATFCGT